MDKFESGSWNKSDFWFELPEHLIAQTPITPRDHSRMMEISRAGGAISHRHFYDLPQALKKGDLLVINDSRVLPARLYGEKRETGGAMEFLLLEQREQDIWEVLVRPGKRAKEGTRFVFGGGLLEGEVLATVEGGNRLVRFSYEGSFYEVLEKIGQMPLPPYITQKLEDKERYQTVYSKEVGSAAAPTAGLHFTPRLMEELEGEWGCALPASRCMWGSGPSARSRWTTSKSTRCIPSTTLSPKRPPAWSKRPRPPAAG